MKKLIVANWKMQLTTKEAVKLARQLGALKWSGLELVLCPSFTALEPVARALKKKYLLGAQDVFWARPGAYTGEIAAADLKELGCQYVLIGHSERRQFLGETDQMVGQKVPAALEAGLTPVVCVGESEAERRRGEEETIVKRQLAAALDGLAVGRKNLVIAYEPVWAIGSGRTPKPREIQAMHQLIARALEEANVTQARVIYGGSVTADNILDFVNLPEVDGALIGGASPDFKKFKALLQTLKS